jgi:hypothetical protein
MTTQIAGHFDPNELAEDAFFFGGFEGCDNRGAQDPPSKTRKSTLS